MDRQQLGEEQKQAASAALVHVNQAIATDPTLNSREMCEMRAKMFEACRRGSRFQRETLSVGNFGRAHLPDKFRAGVPVKVVASYSGWLN